MIGEFKTNWVEGDTGHVEWMNNVGVAINNLSAQIASIIAQGTGGGSGGGASIVDNGDGTLSATSGITDNGDGTLSA